MAMALAMFVNPIKGIERFLCRFLPQPLHPNPIKGIERSSQLETKAYPS